jgi:hypothetical protein
MAFARTHDDRSPRVDAAGGSGRSSAISRRTVAQIGSQSVGEKTEPNRYR